MTKTGRQPAKHSQEINMKTLIAHSLLAQGKAWSLAKGQGCLLLAFSILLLLLIPYASFAQTSTSVDPGGSASAASALLCPAHSSLPALACDGPPPAILGDADHVIKVVEAQLGGPPMYLSGYGTYTPPVTQPAYDALCHISDAHGNPVGFFPQCLRTDDAKTTYLVLLTAGTHEPANEWQHSLYCVYGQAFGGGGLSTDNVIQTAGGNDNGKFKGACVAGGLAAALGSISATVSDVPFKTPTSGSIVKIGLEASVRGFTTPTWGCLADVAGARDHKQEWLYFGCSSSGVFNAFAFGSAIALTF
jgi:hypothetical protein